MTLPAHVEDVNMRRNLEYLLDKIQALEGAKPSSVVTVSGSTTKHKWEVKVDDTDIAAPKVQLIDLGV